MNAEQAGCTRRLTAARDPQRWMQEGIRRMIFKPRRWRCVLLLVAAMLLGAILVEISCSRPIDPLDILFKATAYAVGATIATYVIRIDRLRVEISATAIRGPVRQWLWFTPVEASWADVDLPASRGSFWRGSFVRLRTGQKITLDSLHLGMKQIREIFKILAENAANQPSEGTR